MIDAPSGRDGCVRCKDAGSVDSSAIGATEDAAACVHSASRRPVLVLLEVLSPTGLVVAAAACQGEHGEEEQQEQREPLRGYAWRGEHHLPLRLASERGLLEARATAAVETYIAVSGRATS